MTGVAFLVAHHVVDGFEVIFLRRFDFIDDDGFGFIQLVIQAECKRFLRGCEAYWPCLIDAIKQRFFFGADGQLANAFNHLVVSRNGFANLLLILFHLIRCGE